MKIFKEDVTLDAVAEPEDIFEIEIQKDIAGGIKLYVNVNGKTILRISKIPLENIALTGSLIKDFTNIL